GEAFFYAVRARDDQRLIGVLGMPWVSWSNRLAWMYILIGSEQDIPVFLPEALEMAMRIVFEELDMNFLVMSSGEFAPVTLNLLLASGLKIQVRQRKYVFCHSRFWDRLLLGMSQTEWKSLRREN
ncbi:MAG: hypothetical protein AB1453_15835, partial [Chloroflexota bacterium]